MEENKQYINADAVPSPSKKQMPGLYQSKGSSGAQGTNLPPLNDDDKTIVNEDGQNQVTNGADPNEGVKQKEAKEKSFYKNDLPDDEEDENAVDKALTDEGISEEDENAVDKALTDEGISEEDGKPDVDKEGNEIGGQG